MKNKIINYIRYQKRRFYRLLIELSSYIFAFKLSRDLKRNTKSKIFIIGTPEHGNLGDQAIAHAEVKFLKESCKQYSIYELQYSQVKQSIKVLNRTINDNDVLMLHGGGNLGVEYFGEEELRREIIKNFSGNKIIVFPQTIHFDESDFGKKEFEITKNIYSAHKRLTLIAREIKSHEIMINAFSENRIILTPDIVLYLNQTREVKNRKGILFCLRNDVESVLNNEFKRKLINEVSRLNNVHITDTVVNHSIGKKKRNNELYKIWTSFQTSKLIITDRLHGMVFAAITSTPCIALSNYNHKVKGTYEWIKHLPYIKFVENQDNIMEHIDELLSLDPSVLDYDNSFAVDYYNEILTIINVPDFGGGNILMKEKLV